MNYQDIIIIFIPSHYYLSIDMMKARPSRPSFEKHYTRKEIMLRRTKVLND
jgi:hypothetical protein